MEMTEQFDGWLERQLDQRLTPLSPVTPRPGQARYQAVLLQRRSWMLRILPATAAAKAVAAVATVAAAGAVTAGAVTHSPNPLVWGQQVRAKVVACQSAAAAAGTHGIGECVSDFASQNGQQQRSTHAASQGQTHSSTNPGAAHSSGRP
jgi:hypothetical protein